jgi:hypothetical protein
MEHQKMNSKFSINHFSWAAGGAADVFNFNFLLTFLPHNFAMSPSSIQFMGEGRLKN